MDRWGNRLASTDPRTLADGSAWETRYEYDAANRLTRQLQQLDTVGTPTGGITLEGKRFAETRIDYNAQGQQRRLSDARGNVTEQPYDAAGQLTRTTHADRLGGEAYGYDVFGQRGGAGLAAEV